MKHSSDSPIHSELTPQPETDTPQQQEPSPQAINGSHQRGDLRLRILWKVLFAIVLALVCSVARGQSAPPARIANVGVCCDYVPTQPDHVSRLGGTRRTSTNGGVVPVVRQQVRARPVSAELVASLSNFDADADPDGWRAEVVLRDRNDRPVSMRANATFVLTPRVATADPQRFVNASDQSIRWSMPLTFDEDGVARVKLPLRETLKPLLGWNAAKYLPSGRVAGSRPNTRESRTRHYHGTFVTSDLRSHIGRPSTGELRVRVSVPTEGVFEAASPVFIRPSVLVDTQWPYR